MNFKVDPESAVAELIARLPAHCRRLTPAQHREVQNAVATIGGMAQANLEATEAIIASMASRGVVVPPGATFDDVANEDEQQARRRLDRRILLVSRAQIALNDWMVRAKLPGVKRVDPGVYENPDGTIEYDPQPDEED